jgi:hypothetical protein
LFLKRILLWYDTLDILQVLVCEGILGQSSENRDPSAAGLSRVEINKEITAEIVIYLDEIYFAFVLY